MIDGIRCNVCRKPMPARIDQPLSVSLAPTTLANGVEQRISCQFIANGSEHLQVLKPTFDGQGVPIGEAPVSETITKPKDFDICIKCQVEFAEIMAQTLRDQMENILGK